MTIPVAELLKIDLKRRVGELALTAQNYLKAAGKWTRPDSTQYFYDYAYYKYGKDQRKWFRNYNRRMAAKYMVKMYLLIKENYGKF